MIRREFNFGIRKSDNETVVSANKKARRLLKNIEFLRRRLPRSSISLSVNSYSLCVGVLKNAFSLVNMAQGLNARKFVWR